MYRFVLKLHFFHPIRGSQLVGVFQDCDTHEQTCKHMTNRADHQQELKQREDILQIIIARRDSFTDFEDNLSRSLDFHENQDINKSKILQLKQSLNDRDQRKHIEHQSRMSVFLRNQSSIENDLSFFKYTRVELQENIAEKNYHIREFKKYPGVSIFQIIFISVNQLQRRVENSENDKNKLNR